MAHEPKVAMISATSGFTPGIVAYLSTSSHLQGGLLSLYSRSGERLAPVVQVAERLVQGRGADIRVEGVTDRQQALERADIVICAVRSGGIDAHRIDVELPLKYGVYQGVGDTVGPGGVFAGLRNITLVNAIARDMEKLCPEAWMLNLTNPMATVCGAVQEATSIRVIGLCPGIYDVQRYLARVLDADPLDVDVKIAGLNHLTWAIDIRVRGEDAYPLLRRAVSEGKLSEQPISAKLLEVYGLYPCPADRHVAEFFRFYHRRETDGGQTYGLKLRDVDAMVAARRRYWLDLNRHTAKAQSLEELLKDLGTEALAGQQVLDVVTGLAGNTYTMQTVNIQNHGAIGNLSDDALVEVPAAISAAGARALCVGSLPVAIAGILQGFVAQQELVVTAALDGSRQAVLQALSLDPLIPSMEGVEALTDELLEAHAAYLPQFA